MSLRDGRSAIVLAGGASARFGGDKLAAELDGRPLLHHALAAVDGVAATVVLVLAPREPPPRLPPLDARVLIAADRDTHQGPLAGLAAGLGVLADAAPSIDAAVLVGGDMPTLVPAVLAAMLDALAADPGADVVTLEAEPVAALPMALRRSRLAPLAETILGEGRRALRAVLDRATWRVLPAPEWRELDPEGLTLRDVDWPADLRRR